MPDYTALPSPSTSGGKLYATVPGSQSGTLYVRLKAVGSTAAGPAATAAVPAYSAPAASKPVAKAGDARAIQLPTNSTVLDGTAQGGSVTIATVAWSQVSGPSTATFSSTSAYKPTVSGLVAGSYVFQLVVTDSNGVASDPATVMVGVQVAAATSSPVVLASTTATRWAAAGIERPGVGSDILHAALSYDVIDLQGTTAYTPTAASGYYSYDPAGNPKGATVSVQDMGTGTVYQLAFDATTKTFPALTGLSGGLLHCLSGQSIRAHEQGNVLGNDFVSHSFPAGSLAKLVAPTAFDTEIAIFSDSRSNGALLPNPATQSWPVLLRTASQNTSVLGYGSAQGWVLFDPSNYGWIQARTSASASRGKKKRVAIFDLAINDWLENAATPTNLAARYKARIQQFVADYPDVYVLSITGSPCTTQSTANAGGFVLADYNTALTSALTGLARVSVYQGSDIVSLSDLGGNGNGDGVVHGSTTWHSKYATFLQGKIDALGTTNYPTTAGTIPLTLSATKKQYMQLKGERDLFTDALFMSMVVQIGANASFANYPVLYGKGREATGQDTTVQCYILPDGRLEVDYHAAGDANNAEQHIGFVPGLVMQPGGTYHIMVQAATGQTAKVWVNGTAYEGPAVLNSILHKSTQPINIGVATQGLDTTDANGNTVYAPPGGYLDMTPGDFLVASRVLTDEERTFLASTDGGQKRVGQISSTGTLNFNTAGLIGYCPLLGFTAADIYYVNLVNNNRAFGLEVGS